MANGIPDVAPGQAPGAFQSITASADSFGGQTGRAAQNLGQNLDQASSNIIKTDDIFNQAASEDAANQYQERVSKLLHGDPDNQNVGPTGPIPGYLSLKGRAALDSRPEVEKQIDSLTKEISGGLQNPLQQKQFGDFAAKYKLQQLNQVATHADNEQQVWYAQVNKSTATLALNSIALNAENPEAFAAASADLISARVKDAQLSGGGPELVNAAVQTGKQEALKAQTEAISVKNPSRAMEILDQNKEIAGTAYDELSTKFRTRAHAQQGLEAADAAIAGAISTSAPPIPAPTTGMVPATPEQLNAAILQQESGANPNVPPSVDGAIGPGQILPATFKAYALPGEIIGNPQDNQAVSRRITDAYFQKYNGDPDRVAVAYFSGEGNVAPAGSPTPWIRDAKDGNGKSVSSYVADVQTKMGGTAPPVAMASRIASSKASAVQAVMDRKDLAPEAKQAALTQINQTFAAQQIAAEQDAAAKRAANEVASDKYTKVILKPGGIQPSLLEDIRLDPNLTAETKRTLTEAAKKQSGDDVDKLTQDYGKGFWDTMKRVTAAPGDPNRITDVSELYRRAGPGGDLNLQGVEKLRSAMTEMAKPETASMTAMKNGAIAYAKNQLSFEYPEYGIKDPQGMDIFNSKFIPSFYNAFDAGIASNKTPYQLLSKDSPDYIVDKIVSGFKRTSAQIAQDRLSSLSAMDATPETNQKIDTSTLEGLQAAVGAKQMTREDAMKLAVERGYASATPVVAPAAISVPVR